MTVRPIFAASLLVTSLGALTTSFAQDGNLTSALDDYLMGPITLAQEDDEGMMPAPEDAQPQPDVTAPATEPVTEESTATPVPQPSYVEPPVNVTITPEDRDTLINKDVVDALSSDPRLSGKIGVETYRQVVTLSGRVTNPMQAERAEQIARGVTDVNDVQNLIRARVGG